MKKLKAKMETYFDKLDDRWRALPLRKQQQYTLYFFTGYLLLTTGVVFKVWYDTENSASDMVIRHIENPVKVQDTLTTILKNKIHERKGE